jgi:hypothetical protein
MHAFASPKRDRKNGRSSKQVRVEAGSLSEQPGASFDETDWMNTRSAAIERDTPRFQSGNDSDSELDGLGNRSAGHNSRRILSGSVSPYDVSASPDASSASELEASHGRAARERRTAANDRVDSSYGADLMADFSASSQSSDSENTELLEMEETRDSDASSALDNDVEADYESASDPGPEDDTDEDEDVHDALWDERPDGRRRSFYYDADTAVREDQLDIDELDEEEAEAMRLQRQQLSRLQAQDFTGGIAVSELARAVDDTAPGGTPRPHAADAASLEATASDHDQVAVREVLRSLSTALQEIIEDLEQLLETAKREQLTTHMERDPLLGLLELKRQLLLNYGTNLAFYLALKAEGSSIRDHPVMDRLMEIGVTLDKIRPLEEHVRVRLEALKRAGQQQSTSALRPEFAQGSESDDSLPASNGTSTTDQTDEGATGRYRPLLTTAETYEDERTRRRREQAAARADADQRPYRFEVRQLARELSDKPEQVSLNADPEAMTRDDMRLVRQAEARQAYEEEHLVRLPESKKDRRARRLAEATRGLTAIDSKTRTSGMTDLLSVANRIVEVSQRDQSQVHAMPPKALHAERTSRAVDRHRSDVSSRPSTDSQAAAAAAASNQVSEAFLQRAQHSTFDQSATDKRAALSAFEGSSAPSDWSSLLYKAAADTMQRKRQKRTQGSAEALVASPDDDLLAENRPRRITDEIRRNRGLTARRPRNAAHRNPRVKRRVRYAEALVRRKGQVRVYDDRTRSVAAAGAYKGETSGINKRTRQSVVLRT